ncbi:MAG: amidohydrolase [Myxococcales bacterium]
MRIVDTHLHLVYRDKFSYPWLSGVPPLDKQWTVESYFTEAEKLGIETALHVEVDVSEQEMADETRFVLDGLHPRIGGAIAAARPEHVDFPNQLDQLVAMPGVKGVRRILHTEPDELSQGELFVSNVRRLSAHGLTFDLCVRADQLPVGRLLAARCPDVTFIMDHCGVPDVAGQALDPWRENIKRIAELPNVNAKISGVVAYAKPDWTVDDLRPFVEHVIQTFGWDRVMWGSDHPVCTLTANLNRWVEATHAIIAGASKEQKAALLHRNAECIYRMEAAPSAHS